MGATTTRRRTTKAAAPAPTKPKGPSGDELLDQLSPTKRRADCYIILSGDLLDEWETENNKLAEMRVQDQAAASRRLTQGVEPSADVKAQARKVQRLEQKMEAQQMHFVFENMEPAQHSALAASYPPRSENQFDRLVGYDREAVARESVRLCLVEPTFSDEGWERLMAVIPPGEWAELLATCDKANGRVGQLPKSQLAASLLRGRNAVSSTSPETGG